jgi:hypothetical protein
VVAIVTKKPGPEHVTNLEFALKIGRIAVDATKYYICAVYNQTVGRLTELSSIFCDSSIYFTPCS